METSSSFTSEVSSIRLTTKTVSAEPTIVSVITATIIKQQTVMPIVFSTAPTGRVTFFAPLLNFLNEGFKIPLLSRKIEYIRLYL